MRAQGNSYHRNWCFAPLQRSGKEGRVTWITFVLSLLRRPEELQAECSAPRSGPGRPWGRRGAAKAGGETLWGIRFRGGSFWLEWLGCCREEQKSWCSGVRVSSFSLLSHPPPSLGLQKRHNLLKPGACSMKEKLLWSLLGCFCSLWTAIFGFITRLQVVFFLFFFPFFSYFDRLWLEFDTWNWKAVQVCFPTVPCKTPSNWNLITFDFLI